MRDDGITFEQRRRNQSTKDETEHFMQRKRRKEGKLFGKGTKRSPV